MWSEGSDSRLLWRESDSSCPLYDLKYGEDGVIEDPADDRPDEEFGIRLRSCMGSCTPIAKID
jgi:hypothetical protein